MLIDQKLDLIKESRIKYNDKFVYQQPFTPIELIDEISNKITAPVNSSVLVLFTIEWAVYLQEKGYKDIAVAVDTHDKIIHWVCNTVGIKYLLLDEIKEKKLKFDVVVGNPPYDKGIKLSQKLPFSNRVGVYSAFCFMVKNLLKDTGVCTFVLPCNFMCLPSAESFRSWLMSNYNITQVELVDNSKQQVFKIGMSDVLVLTLTNTTQPTNNTQVKWIAYGSNPFIIDLTKYDIWPMYRSSISVEIFDSVMMHKTRNIKEFDGGDTDKQKYPRAPYFISGNLTRMGARQNPNPRVTNKFQKNVIRDIKMPIWIAFEVEQENDIHFEWMATQHYAYVLSMIQSTPKNQPIFFSYMGEHNFQDTDFVRTFNITAEHTSEINNWHKNLTT
jgi:hypothetical protein